MFPKFYSYWRCTLTCVLTHQLYNKYHNCEKTKPACLCYTHTYTQCRRRGMWWKTFFVSSAAVPWVPPRQGNVFASWLASPTLLQVQGSWFYRWVRLLPQSPLVLLLPFVSSEPLLPHTSSFFSAQEADLNGWHQQPPWPFGSLLNRPVGSSRELKGGRSREGSSISDSFPWGHLDLTGSLSSWKPPTDFLATLFTSLLPLSPTNHSLRASQVMLVVKNLPANAGDVRDGFHPQVRKIPCRRAWQPSPVFLSGESHGQRSLMGYNPWGLKELDSTEVTKCVYTHTSKHAGNHSLQVGLK